MGDRQRYAIDDMLGFVPNEHDVRVGRGDYVYWIRGVRRGSSLTISLARPVIDQLSYFAGLLGFLEEPLVGAYALAQRRARWKVGVVRVLSTSVWVLHRQPVVIHSEVLTAGVEPHDRIAELAEQVRAGRFDRRNSGTGHHS